MKTNKSMILSAGLIGAMTLSACAVTGPDGSEEELAGRAGLALTVDTLADTDIARMRTTVTGVDCGTGEPIEPEFAITEIRDLDDMLIPGGNADLEGNPLDAGSGHLFADTFFWLPEGCYDVVVQPIQEDGSDSEDCGAASASQVAVFDGETTEIMLVHQCDNEGAGGLDVISAVNHAPQLDAVSYAPSKFTCDGTTTICATASDPDNDPLSFDWQISGPADASVASIEEGVSEEGVTQSCATFLLGAPGDYQVSVVVRDLAWAGDALVPIEELGLDGVDASNDEANLLIHALSPDACEVECACPEGFELNADATACELFVSVPAEQVGDFRSVCAGDTNINYGAEGALFPDGTVVTGGFFGDGTYSAANGSRLNTIGIWACNGAEDEWIGFSRCIEVEEAGEYVVGVSGDDYVRFFLNGQLLYEETVTPFHFRHWMMIPVTLQPGTHIIEMEGYDVGVAAAFGAEIYGPFPLGSTADDATMSGLDYENNIIWTTGDQIGSNFNTGSISGYACEDGFALDLCGDDAVCTSIERQACE